MAFEDNLYCDFSGSATKAVAGKDILLAIFNSTGDKLLAVAGQQGLTINRSKDSIEVTSKDTKGGWKAKIGGMKEWSIDNDGLYVADDESHKTLGKAFEDDEFVCLKVINQKTKEAMFGGLAIVSDYSLEAPFDDAMTYSISLEGNGPLVDLSNQEGSLMPGESEAPAGA
ncbi:phage major tail protein, TP901-1 family [Caldifermentibacillus hisashii]|uniref:phage major tail protein, TP901-1 family n=1 Tax=Caldifermentibacillus hisashii TaxID=996558 RepID=UPI0031FC8B99